MTLFIAATAMEMAPFAASMRQGIEPATLITGMGPVETTLQLIHFLTGDGSRIRQVIQFGVGGAYPDQDLSLLDLCAATREVLGDFGIATVAGIESFAGIGSQTPTLFDLDRHPACLSSQPSTASSFFQQMMAELASQGRCVRQGCFVTVNSVSGTMARGVTLRDRHNGICENMEGAAAARVCAHLGLPFFELRAISNMVEDREPSQWRLAEAIEVAASAAAGLAAAVSMQRSTPPA